MLVIYLSFFRFLFDAIKFVLLVQINLSFFGSLLYSLEKNIRNAISFVIVELRFRVFTVCFKRSRFGKIFNIDSQWNRN